MASKDFVEIHTPKLIEGASEGGADCFKTNYFGKPATLAQSPQLYKQMAVMSDFPGVFEVAPVFRSEDSNTHRHMCEFTGLDMEMSIKSHYFEALDLLGEMFNSIFTEISTRYSKEIGII